MQHEKFRRLYKIIEALLTSVPEPLKDIVKNELLDKAIQLQDRNLNYIFVSLKHRKLEVLKYSKHKVVYVEYDTVEGELGTESCDDGLYIVEDLSSVYAASKLLTPLQQRVLQEMVKLSKDGKQITAKGMCKKFGFSDVRWYKVLGDIRKILLSFSWRTRELISERATEDGAKIKDIGELYSRLRQRN